MEADKIKERLRHLGAVDNETNRERLDTGLLEREIIDGMANEIIENCIAKCGLTWGQYEQLIKMVDAKIRNLPFDSHESI